MQEESGEAWLTDLGLADQGPPHFFRSSSQLDAAPTIVPQAHAIRRALDELDLDGVLCIGSAPSVYLKRMPNAEPSLLRRLHRRVWNQGLAPVLVILTDKDVRVYSGYASPAASDDEVDTEHRLIETLEYAGLALSFRHLVLAIETGEIFRVHSASFAPERRVDRALLSNLGAARAELQAAARKNDDHEVVDRLLCRLVFTCYLVDRQIIDGQYFSSAGVPGAARLLDIFEPSPRRARPVSEARRLLYELFAQLKRDFNGDMFSADLEKEALGISDAQVRVLHKFLRGDNLVTQQLGLGFQIYDFSVIPIETISSIYEEFLKARGAGARAERKKGPRPPKAGGARGMGAVSDGLDASGPSEQRSSGAYYTPRFLAEVLLDTAVDGVASWRDSRYFDPACGSGILLVGMFHRLAEEWKRRNSGASYEEQVDALLRIATSQLCGADRNPTACRIAAFSLYVAFLDQLTPRTIRQLQARGRCLPPLVVSPRSGERPSGGRTIHHADFGDLAQGELGEPFDVIIGNPPWVSRGGAGDDVDGEEPGAGASLFAWCRERGYPVPQRQLAYAFVWKSGKHLRTGGRVCFLLPYGVLFNHDDGALTAQRAWFSQYPPECIINLADLRFMLFEGARKPALIVRFSQAQEGALGGRISYHVPKASLGVLHGCRLTLDPDDCSTVLLADVLDALGRNVAPTVWKQRMWGTPRDERLLVRLLAYPRLGDITDQARDRRASVRERWKRWVIGEGFQPLGAGDDIASSKPAFSRTTRFIPARSPNVALLLLPDDCPKIAHKFGRLRRRPEREEIFQAPHVIITKGLKVAYADFDVVFQHAARGLHGPPADTDLLIFLAAYLRSPLGQYLLFHTAANWGNERDEVHVAELLRLPFPLPEDLPNPARAREILAEVRAKVTAARETLFFGRETRISLLQESLRSLIDEYFGIDGDERTLIDDTIKIAIPSATPRKNDLATVPSVLRVDDECATYVAAIGGALNDWAKRGKWQFKSDVVIAERAGLAVVSVQRASRNAPASGSYRAKRASLDLSTLLVQLKPLLVDRRGTIAFSRSLKVFLGDVLHIVKPLGRRYWSATAALNDADEIARAVVASSGSARGRRASSADVQRREK